MLERAELKQTGSSYRIIVIHRSGPPESIDEKLFKYHCFINNYRNLLDSKQIAGRPEYRKIFAARVELPMLMNIFNYYPAFYISQKKGPKMQTLIWLANDIPYVMAPAALIAAMVGISAIAAVIRLTQQASKVMMVGVMIALTVGAMIIELSNKLETVSSTIRLLLANF
jgi:hypothetical protein